MDPLVIEKISAQALEEIQFSRIFKQGKTKNWITNEQMYYGGYKKLVEARASVQLGRMQEFVHTLLSKIDNPLVFKFQKRKNSQLKRVNRLNALRQIDQDLDNWDIKDIVGKKQAIIYGRAIYAYYADSIKGKYRAHLEPIDVYDFLIDPSCGGLDIEEARFLGSYSVVLDKKSLEQGIKDGIYLEKETQRLIDGNGNADTSTQEETNKRFRTYDQGTVSKREGESKDKFKFWRWFTTYEGERYYLLITNNGDVIRCEAMKDLFPTSEDYKEGMWPFWTWAAFPDLTEFWTPSYCDYVREILMAQDVTVNQMLDNVEAINKPQKIVNVTAIENLAELKYRRDGVIKVKGDIDASKAIQFVQTPQIDTPMKLWQLLEGIHEKASGVTAQSKGVDDAQGKVGIYQGNEAAAADRFGLLNKSYSFGYKRFARLYEMNVKEHLIRKTAIEIMGANGVEMEEVSRRDIFKKGDQFGVCVEASNAEMLASEQSKTQKMNFLTAQMLQPIPTVNKKKAIEMQAEISGFTQDQIDDLLDMANYGNSDLMSDADADIESVLLGEEVQPNRSANVAYKQHIVDYMNRHDKNLTMDEFTRLSNFVDSLDQTIMRNEARRLQNEVNQAKLNAPPQMPQPPQQGIPLQPQPQIIPQQ